MKRELLFSVTIHDCEVQTFTAGGPGGQHQNRTESAVRIIHRPSGASGECRELKSQRANKERAFKRMAESEKFKRWIRVETARRAGKPSITEQVRREMNPAHLKIETLDGKNRWQQCAELMPNEQEISSLFEEQEYPSNA